MQLCIIIEQYFPKIEEVFGTDFLKKFRTSKYSDLHMYHWTLGLWIRNTLLEQEQSLKQALISHKITDRDDMSSLILRLFYLYEQQRP